MTLPKVSMPMSTVDVDGQSVSVHGLTRSEAMKVKEVEGSLSEMEILILTFGTDTPEAEVRDWYASVPAGDVEPLIRAISTLSGLDQDLPKATGGRS